MKFFFDQDGTVWSYDPKTNRTNCELGDYHIIDEGMIVFCYEDGEVIDNFTLYDYKLFDKII